MIIPGLPEGVECVRFSPPAGPDEFELYGPHIIKGGRQSTARQIVVAPAAGYSFVPETYGLEHFFVVAKDFEEPQTIVAAFTVKNSYDQDRIDRAFTLVEDLRTKEDSGHQEPPAN